MNIQIISAGAGSGKTYRLTQDLVSELKGGVRAKAVIATTFTKKAAAELQERVRVKLLEEGMQKEADDLSAALLGTVHSVGTRILERFAFEAGVSPLLEIIADEDQKLFFNQSLSQVLSEARIEQMNLLSEKLGFHKDHKRQKDWRADIQSVTEIARTNGFEKADLEKSKKGSLERFFDMLPKAEGKQPDTGIGWNNKLAGLVKSTIKSLKENDIDTTKATTGVIKTLENISRELRYQNGVLEWYRWAQVSKIKPGKKSAEIVEALKDFAKQVEAHPSFITDLTAYISLVFDIVVDAQIEYGNYKRKRGLIDYTDMETQVAKLLDRPEVQAALAGEIDLLMVDEFQDTSPIQLDIFLKISKLAKKAIWVGDPKQSIYGFRGAEPALMKAILEKTGGVRPENIQKYSWRSRTDIVHACNAIFIKAFNDIPEDQVALEPKRTKDKEPKDIDLALQSWHFEKEPEGGKRTNVEWFLDCIGDQVRIALEQGPLIQPKGSNLWRPLVAGDIGILCRSNKNCVAMAESLHKAGLKATIARTGLLETIEVRLVLACLKIFLNPADALSIAELQILAKNKELVDIISDRLHFLATKEEFESDLHWAQEDKFVQDVRYMRSKTEDLSASEILDLLLSEMDIRRLVLQFGDSGQRLANLEVLRKMARQYEDNCQRVHSAATLSGFLLWLNRQLRQGNDKQAMTTDTNAVQVLTYHKSKGLEFPMVICAGLEGKMRAEVWGANLINESKEVDLENILANRWVQFWVNPFADQIRGTRLEAAIKLHPSYLEKQISAKAEEARLLYVGLTRARDYLVFPSRNVTTGWLNRVFNEGDSDANTLEYNQNETPFYYPKDSLEPIEIEAVNEIKTAKFGAVELEALPSSFFAEPLGKQVFPAKYVDSETALAPSGLPGFGSPLSFSISLNTEKNQVKDTEKILQHCLLCQWENFSEADRMALVENQIMLFSNAGLENEEVVKLCTDFYDFLKEQYNPIAIHRHYPIHAPYQSQALDMTIDLMLETKEKTILIKIGTATDGMKRWKNVAQAAATPLQWAEVGLGLNAESVEKLVVLPLDGAVVQVV